MNIAQKNRREYRRLKKSNRVRVMLFLYGPDVVAISRYLRSRITAVALA